MFRKLTSAAAITIFGFVQVASAQWQVSPQYGEIQPSWSTGQYNMAPMQGYDERPYVPYPG